MFWISLAVLLDPTWSCQRAAWLTRCALQIPTTSVATKWRCPFWPESRPNSACACPNSEWPELPTPWHSLFEGTLVKKRITHKHTTQTQNTRSEWVKMRSGERAKVKDTHKNRFSFLSFDEASSSRPAQIWSKLYDTYADLGFKKVNTLLFYQQSQFALYKNTVGESRWKALDDRNHFEESGRSKI